MLIAACLTIISCGDKKEQQKPEVAETDTTQVVTTDSVAKKEDPKEPEGPDLHGTERQLAFMQKCGAWDRYKTGILPQMAQEEPDYCEKLLKSKYPHFIIVDKNKMKLFLYDKYGNIVKSYGMACSRNYGTKHKKGDNRTADGFFSAEGIYDSTNWRYTNDAGYTSPARGVFGPRFIRVDVPITRAIGIHGTSSPGSIGSRASHGCIRLTNENLMDLVQYAEVGMPIIISPGPRDMLVNEQEGYPIPSVTTEPGGTRAVAGQAAMAYSKDNDKSSASSGKSADKSSSTKKDSSKAPAASSNSTEKQTDTPKNPESEAPTEHKEAPETPKAAPEPAKEPVKEVSKEQPAETASR